MFVMNKCCTVLFHQCIFYVCLMGELCSVFICCIFTAGVDPLYCLHAIAACLCARAGVPLCAPTEASYAVLPEHLLQHVLFYHLSSYFLTCTVTSAALLLPQPITKLLRIQRDS